MLKLLIPANLTLFDEDGGGSAPAGAASLGGAAASGEDTSETQAQALPGRGATSAGAFKSAVSGGASGTPDAAGPDAGGDRKTQGDAAPPAKTPEERRAEYERLREEYKDLFSEDFQKTLNRRFKASKEMEAAFKTQSDFINRLHQVHGTKTVDELDKVLMGSADILKPLADKAGMKVGAYRNHMGALLGSAGYLRTQDERAGEARDDKLIMGAVKEAMALKANPEFARFDLGQELRDPVFRKKLLSGQSVKSAYLDKYYDGLMKSARQSAEKSMEKRVVDSIRAKGNRPAENGTNVTAGKVYVNDVSKLTKAQRAEAAKRAQKGEKITFR